MDVASTTSTITQVMLSRPPRLVGQPHQLAGGLGGVGQAPQGGGEAVVVDLVEEAVAADQVAVADHRDDLPGVDEHGAVDAQSPGEDVALRVDRRLGAGQAALALHRGDEAVILGDLREGAVGEQVEPGVADVDHGDGVAALGVDEGHGAQGRAHALEVVVGPRLGHDGVVGLLDGVDEDLGGGRDERLLEDLRGRRGWRRRRHGGHPCRRPRRTGRRRRARQSSLTWRTRPVSLASPHANFVTAAPARCCRPGPGRPGP